MNSDQEPTGAPPPGQKEVPEIDEDRLELLERRLADNVDSKVRQSLFKFYGAIGVVVIAVAGYAGFDFIQQTKDEVRSQAIKAATDMVAAEVDPLAAKARDTLVDLQVKMGVFDELQQRTVTAVEELQKSLAEFQPQAKNLQNTINEVQDLDVKRRDLETRLDTIAKLVGSLEDITKNMTDLAKKVDGLGESVSSLSQKFGETQVTQETATLRTELGNVIAASEQAQTAIQDVQQSAAQTVVYFQYYAMPPDQVKATQEMLRKAGFKVPGAEQQPMRQSGLYEVRYYWPNDQPEAERLAATAGEILKRQNIVAPAVVVKDYTKWERAKPRAGTIELWLGLPEQAAAE